jgi:hypothetical protein
MSVTVLTTHIEKARTLQTLKNLFFRGLRLPKLSNFQRATPTPKRVSNSLFSTVLFGSVEVRKKTRTKAKTLIPIYIIG